MHIAVLDVGKPFKNIGWAIEGAQVVSDGTDLDPFVDALAVAHNFGPIALGFEAPLFVPVRESQVELTKARNGECRNGVNRPFSAGAGAAVLVTALTVVPYVLTRLRQNCPRAEATLDRRAPLGRKQVLFFEAFISNQKKTDQARHIDDAKLAIGACRVAIDGRDTHTSFIADSSCLSLIGAMLLRTGWSNDSALVTQTCLVVGA